MSSTKKRVCSPEINGLSSMCQGTAVQICQNAPPKRPWQGPKDDRLKALQKLERKHCSTVFRDTNYQPIITGAPQLNTHVHRTAPAPAKSPLQRSPGLAVLHSPPLLPAQGEEGRLESFNDSPVVPHVPLSSGLHTVSSVQDNHALFHQTYHLNDHTSTWNQCRNNQATERMSCDKTNTPLFFLYFPYQNTPMHHGQGDPTWDLQRTNQKMSTRQSPS
jgi:hypothetical protein